MVGSLSANAGDAIPIANVTVAARVAATNSLRINAPDRSN
jgi:hypothetical protein